MAPLDELLRGHDVDWVKARPRVHLARSSLTGRERTAGGLMPADHGGVISVLSVRRG